MMLNADSMKIEAIWELLRPAATAAGPNTNLFAEIVETINSMKLDAARGHLTAYKAWAMVLGLCTRENGCLGVNTLQSSFMVNLKRIGFLDYLLVPSQHQEDAELFQCENKFDWDMLLTTKSKMAKSTQENKSTFLKKSMDHSEHIFEVNSKGNTCQLVYKLKINFSIGKKILAPLQWRMSVPLWMAEYIMIYQLVADIPAEFTLVQTTAEIQRRIEETLYSYFPDQNKENLERVAEEGYQTVRYNTPYELMAMVHMDLWNEKEK